MVCGDLERFRRIAQAMDLIQNDPSSPEIRQEFLRILQQATDSREFAVKVFNVSQRFA